MRKTRDKQNRRLFEREEWLTESQVQGFFSRLAASRRRQQAHSEIEHNPKELFLEEKEAERQQLMAHISNELRPQHPLSYEALTCASVRGIISWVFLMFHCLKKSCAFLKYHLNQETGKKTWLNSRVSKIEEPTLILGLIKGDPCFSSFPSFKTHLFCNQFLMSMFSLRMSIGKKNHASMIAWARAFIAI